MVAGGALLLTCVVGAGYWWFFTGQQECIEVEATPELQALLAAQEKVKQARNRDAVAHSPQSQAELRVAEEEYESRKRAMPPIAPRTVAANSGAVEHASAEACRGPK